MSSPQGRPPPGGTPKAMSSRLLTMKFMQRAAAASPTPPSTPAFEEPSPKRQKKNSDSPLRPEFNVDELANKRAVDKAVAEEEAKRQAALEKQGAEAGDTRWVLSFEDQKAAAASQPLPLRVVSAGYASIDFTAPHTFRSSDGEDFSEDKPLVVGRRSFGRFNKRLEKQNDPTIETSSDDGDGEDEEVDEEGRDSSNDEENNPMDEMIRAERTEALKTQRKAKKKAERAKLAQLAKTRKKKEVKLNDSIDANLVNMVSLSGRSAPIVECFSCGGPHIKKDCPKQGNKRLPSDGQQGNLAKKPRTTRGMGH